MSVCGDAQDLKTDRNNPPAARLGCPVGRLTNRRMSETENMNVWGINRHSKRVPGAGTDRPWAEQWETAEELHMMQCPPSQRHGSEMHKHGSSDHFTPPGFNRPRPPLGKGRGCISRPGFLEISIVQAWVGDGREKHVYWPLPPLRLTGRSSSGAQLLGGGPRGPPGALQMLLTPILSTQLTCASLTRAGLLMATAS